MSGDAGVRAQIDSREGIALQNQILRTASRVRNCLQNQVASSGGGAGAALPQRTRGRAARASEIAAATAGPRVDTLEEQVRGSCSGRIDEIANQRAACRNADLAKQIGDLKPSGWDRAASGPGTVMPPRRLAAWAGAALQWRRRPVAFRATAPRTPELAMQQGNAALAGATMRRPRRRRAR